MTEEYFYIEEIQPNADEKKIRNYTADNHDIATKKSQEIRLHEIEHQLEMAESRCNKLKGQVDFMKLLYNGMEKDKSKVVTKRHLGIDVNSTKRKKNDKETSTETKTNPRNEEVWKEVPSRDVDINIKSSNMSTIPHRDVLLRDTREATKSINNIISGITKSVNRLTQLQALVGSTTKPKIENPIGIQGITCAPRELSQKAAAEKPYQSDGQISHTSVKSKFTRKNKRKIKLSNGNKSSTTRQPQRSSVGSINEKKNKIKVTAKHVEKRIKLNQPTSVEINPVTAAKIRRKTFGKLRVFSSRSLLAKKSNNIEKTQSVNKSTEKSDWRKSDRLIELYHNSAVKIATTSEDSITNKKGDRSEKKERVPQSAAPILETTPEIPTLPSFHHKLNFSHTNNIEYYKNPLSPIAEDHTKALPVTGSFFNKNYELPTIASKMKQVARSYFENFSFRTIPFVAAKSTTPSHNLGVNIQQVLSIIKGRKQIAGISPTLAYNIELAANKLGSRPLSALVTNLGSRMCARPCPCPLMRRYADYTQLQEMAKEIPEETADELAAVDDDGDTSAALASGDKDIKPDMKDCNVWSYDKPKEKCTCIPKKGVNFNDVYLKYMNGGKDYIRSTPGVMIPKQMRSKPWNTIYKARSKYIASDETNTSSKTAQMNQKEKSLKDILKNLHDEFAIMNDRYENLKQQVTDGNSDESILQELEKLEKELQNKEDEITMVVSLYNEVLSLKNQVKILKKRASQPSVVVSPLNRARDSNFHDLNAAGHLTKLLRHIQQFQDTLKTKNTL